jgi:hypothetical protein
MGSVVAAEEVSKPAAKNPSAKDMRETEDAQDKSKQGVGLGNRYCYRLERMMLQTLN